MTQYLCERAREVVAVEIDKNLIPILSDTLKNYSNVTVINEDILKLDICKLAEEKNQETNQGCSESALLYYHTDYHGTV